MTNPFPFLARLRQSLAGLAALTCLAAAPACAQPENPAMLIPADAARADVTALYEGLVAAEADLFQATPRAVFEARYHELMARLDQPVSLAELHAKLQRFAALARHAHTRINRLNPVWAAHAEADGPVFPLAFFVAEGEVIISAAPAGSGLAAGDRILALEGEPNPVWLARLTRNISAETPEFAYALLANAEFYYVLLEYGPRDRFTLDIMQDGQRRTVTLEAIALSQLDTLTGSAPGFTLAGREARLLDGNIAYLRPGAFYNLDATDETEAYDAEALAAYTGFIDTSFEDFIAAGATDLVLDLRDNPGGDNSWSDPVIAWFADRPFRFASDFLIRVSAHTTASNAARLEAQGHDPASASARFADLFASAQPGELVSFDLPYAQPRSGARFDGAVHVLVNRYSYSNAVSAGALIQDYGFGTVYGEPTSDMATTYGAMEHFTLEHSGFTVGYPKAMIIRPNGERAPHPLEPDVRLPVPAVRGAQDVMLEALLERLRRPD
jgi:hypothetical protein